MSCEEHVSKVSAQYDGERDRVSVKIECAAGCGVFEIRDWPIAHAAALCRALTVMFEDNDIQVGVVDERISAIRDTDTPEDRERFRQETAVGDAIFDKARANYKRKLN